MSEVVFKEEVIGDLREYARTCSSADDSILEIDGKAWSLKDVLYEIEKRPETELAKDFYRSWNAVYRMHS